jgi:hypothetical protein
MGEKDRLLGMLREELERWDTLLAGLSEARITAPDLPGNWSIKDVIAHLKSWQERSIARCEAALLDREPVFPEWPAGEDPEAENVDRINEWIYETHRARTWAEVRRAWREGFQRFLELGEGIPEEDVFRAGKFPWLDGEPLSVVLLGSYEHHHEEHYGPLVAWLRERGEGLPE